MTNIVNNRKIVVGLHFGLNGSRGLSMHLAGTPSQAGLGTTGKPYLTPYASPVVEPILRNARHLEQIRQGMAWHYKEYQHEQTTQDRLVCRDEEEER